MFKCLNSVDRDSVLLPITNVFDILLFCVHDLCMGETRASGESWDCSGSEE